MRHLRLNCVNSRNPAKRPFQSQNLVSAKTVKQHCLGRSADTESNLLGSAWGTCWSQHCHGPQRTSNTPLKLNMLSASAGQSRRAFSILPFSTHLSSPSDQGRNCSRTPAKCVVVRHQATVHPRLVVKVLPETYINTFFGRKNNTVVRSLRWICRQNGIVATARSEAARGKHAT